MARELAKRSLCSRDQVGALIVDENAKVIGEGYNGPPRHYSVLGVIGDCSTWCVRAMRSVHYRERDYADCPSLHAEANALITSDRSLRRGGTMYVTSHPCFPCAKLIANSGLARLVVAPDGDHEYRRSDDVYEFLRQCQIEWEIV